MVLIFAISRKRSTNALGLLIGTWGLQAFDTNISFSFPFGTSSMIRGRLMSPSICLKSAWARKVKLDIIPRHVFLGAFTHSFLFLYLGLLEL